MPGLVPGTGARQAMHIISYVVCTSHCQSLMVLEIMLVMLQLVLWSLVWSLEVHFLVLAKSASWQFFVFTLYVGLCSVVNPS